MFGGTAWLPMTPARARRSNSPASGRAPPAGHPGCAGQALAPGAQSCMGARPRDKPARVVHAGLRTRARSTANIPVPRGADPPADRAVGAPRRGYACLLQELHGRVGRPLFVHSATACSISSSRARRPSTRAKAGSRAKSTRPITRTTTAIADHSPRPPAPMRRALAGKTPVRHMRGMPAGHARSNAAIGRLLDDPGRDQREHAFDL